MRRYGTTRRLQALLLAAALCLVTLLACGLTTALAAETDDVAPDPDAALETLFSNDVSAERLGKLLEAMSGDANGAGALATKAGNAASSALSAMADDDAKPVGRLKILARYNDSMQFYDGHVYLLFTSYQDGVDLTVPDLYGTYEISDQYYRDINDDILNGSNHTGSDAEKYFSFTNDLTTMTLNRGEIVTIGMYRGFDLSVPQAALGVIENSTLWGSLTDEAKTAIVQVLMQYLNQDSVTAQEALADIQAVLDTYGGDYHNLLDGVVEGGLCLNRELYNQKLEWDQYENVTYELDITQAQLDTLALYLGGNLNKFNILKNSCATVAVRAWNAAVAQNDPESEYYLLSTGEGVWSLIDAPKNVRDSIRATFEGREDYHLNNSEGGELCDQEAGAFDDTGWVYVSAPEPVSAIRYTYEDESITIDESRTKMPALVNAAKKGTQILYDKDDQQVKVTVNRSEQDGVTTVTSVDFDINGTVVSLDQDAKPEGGLWLCCKVAEPKEGESYYVSDGAGTIYPSTYKDGQISFQVDALPASYKVEGSTTATLNILETTIVNPDKADVTTEVYRMDGEQRESIAAKGAVEAGSLVYVKPTFAWDETDHILGSVTLDGSPIKDNAHWDASEGAYVFAMPSSYAKLRISYDVAVVNSLVGSTTHCQVSVGDVLSVSDYAELLVGKDKAYSGRISWSIIDDGDGALGFADDNAHQLTALKEGTALIWAGADDNSNIGVLFLVEVYDNVADMVAVTYPEDSVRITASLDGSKAIELPYSGYLVKKGSVLAVQTTQDDGTVVSDLTANGNSVAVGETIIANKDTAIEVEFREAQIKGMPESIKLSSTGDSYQLDAKVKYSGIIAQFYSVYDPSIRYVASSDLVSVDDTGKITVAGEVPESGKLVIVTAYAGSSNNSVSAQTKVIIGDYHGTDIVGRLTIHARRIYEGELVAHGAATFTTYDDIDLNVSYYHWYRPTAQYLSLMEDYRDNPESYNGLDPALYNDNALGLEDRPAYFDELANGPESEPSTISLRCGESISLSNYGYDRSNLYTIVGAMENGSLASSANAEELIRQIHYYLDNDGEVADGPAAFDSLVATLIEMYQTGQATGSTPANGHTEGGLDVNREIYNEFRRDDSQMPNSFYTVEITADELAQLEAYLSDPSNNYYSLFAKNCATGATDIWNTALFDRPELQLSPNYSGLAIDPESLYLDLTKLRLTTGKTYEPGVQEEGGGEDFYPRTVACYTAPQGKSLIYDGTAQDLIVPGSSKATGHPMVYSLDGKTFSQDIPTATEPGTYVIYYKIDGDPKHTHGKTRSVTSTIVKVEVTEVYRMYNTRSSEHLYTTDADEYAQCGKGDYADWNAEGVAWLAPAEGTPGATAVYRLYNAGLGDHHYTADKAEADELVAKHGWVQESIPFYSGGDVPVYRLYNGGLAHGQHHFTADIDEVEGLTSKHGWTSEGVGLFCVSLPTA